MRKRFRGFLWLMALVVLLACAWAGAEDMIQMEIEPNLTIEAAVVAPDLPGGQIQAIQVEQVRPDGDDLLALLYPGASIAQRSEQGSATIINLSDGASLYASAQFTTFSTEFGGLVNQLRLLQPQLLLDQQAQSQADLAFAGRDEAIAGVQQVLDALGLTGAQCVESYALSRESLQRHSDQMRSRAENASDIRAGRIASKAQWERADECYWLRFAWAYDQVKVFAEPRESIAQSEIGNYFAGSSLEVVVSAQGIQLFRGEDMLRELGREAPQTVLSADQVASLIAQRYRNLIVDAPTAVRRIELMYVIRRSPNQAEALDLIPAWCCQVVISYGPQEMDQVTDWIAFDARTGDMLF